MTPRTLPELPITKSNKFILPEIWSNQTCLMAIINITKDSFSDGGLFFDFDSALKHAICCIQQGCKILDFGAQSTKPGALEIGPELEIDRLLPLIKEIKLINPDIFISVDTFHHLVAQKSLQAGADMINDVSGGRRDPRIFEVIAEYNCPYILTHSRGNSITMDSLTDYNNLILDIKLELEDQIDLAIKSGVMKNQIIIDPGLGFAKNVEQNLCILRNIEEFILMGYPVLVGPSKKRFIGSVIGKSEPNKRSFGTAAVVSRCVSAGVNIIRVHDVRENLDVIKMTKAII